MYEDEKWLLDLHEMTTDIHAAVAAVLATLAEKGIINLEDCVKMKEDVMQQEPYKSVKSSIEEQRALIKRYEDNPSDLLKDLLFPKT